MDGVDGCLCGHPFARLLREQGARLDGCAPVHFGEPDAERSAVAAAPTLHALTADGLLEVGGEDAETFLQGQLSNDVGELSAPRAQLSTYCTPQGRMLASLLTWRRAAAFLLQLPGELTAPIGARLRKYVLRARVQLDDVTPRYALFGVGGPGAAAVLKTVYATVPAERMDKTDFEDGSLLCLGPDLFELAIDIDAAIDHWDRLAQIARPVGTQWWRWRWIQAGLPVVTAATQDRFIPQMANMQGIGAVSFAKGCYPGQEIIARAQYRGQVKRRLLRLHGENGSPEAGQEIFVTRGVAAGAVINAAPAPSGGYDLLAVVHVDSIEHGELRLGGPEGPALARSA